MTTTPSRMAFLSMPMTSGAHGLFRVPASVPTRFSAMARLTLSSRRLVKAIQVSPLPRAPIAWHSWNRMRQETISGSMASNPPVTAHRTGRFRFRRRIRICRPVPRGSLSRVMVRPSPPWSATNQPHKPQSSTSSRLTPVRFDRRGRILSGWMPSI